MKKPTRRLAGLAAGLSIGTLLAFAGTGPASAVEENYSLQAPEGTTCTATIERIDGKTHGVATCDAISPGVDVQVVLRAGGGMPNPESPWFSAPETVATAEGAQTNIEGVELRYRAAPDGRDSACSTSFASLPASIWFKIYQVTLECTKIAPAVAVRGLLDLSGEDDVHTSYIMTPQKITSAWEQSFWAQPGETRLQFALR